MSDYDNFTTLRVVEITDVKEGKDDLVVFANNTHLDGDLNMPFCDWCGTENPTMHKNGSVKSEVSDVNAKGKRVRIVLKQGRLRCVEQDRDGKQCNKTTVMHPPGIHPERQMTKACYDQIARESLRGRFSRIATNLGVGERTVADVCREHIEFLDRTEPKCTPRYLGIDEVNALKGEGALGVATNVEERTLIELLPQCTTDVVGEYLSEMSSPNTVKGVTMDMEKSYADLAQKYFPKADVIVDKWHVLKYAKDAFGEVRKRETRKRGVATEWKKRRFKYLRRYPGELPALTELPLKGDLKFEAELGPMPLLMEAWWLYQRFFNIYDESLTPHEADAAFSAWRAKISEENEGAFAPVTRKLDNWRDGILNYFEHGVTNALTEQKNKFIREIQTEGKGYSFDILRGKALYGPAQVRPAEFGADIEYESFYDSRLPTALPSQAENPTYGASIEALLQGEHEEREVLSTLDFFPFM